MSYIHRNDIVILLSYSWKLVSDLGSRQRILFFQMFVFAFALKDSSIHLFPLEGHTMFTTRDRRRAIQLPSRHGDTRDTPAVWTVKEGRRLKRNWAQEFRSPNRWLCHSHICCQVMGPVLVLRIFMAAGMTRNLLGKPRTFLLL